jgi:sarcosine oxidase subunit gamma
MSAGLPIAHSPLETFAEPFAEVSGPRVRLAELPFLAQVDVRADPSDAALMARLGGVLGLDLPTVPNTAVATPDGSRHGLWLGPNEWLIVGPAGTEGKLEAGLRTALGDGFGAVVDASANRTTLVLAGEAARDILETGCSLDLHPREFGPGRCAQTLVARAGVILHQLSPEPEYRLLVRPSFAAYLATWLLDAIDGDSSA